MSKSSAILANYVPVSIILISILGFLSSTFLRYNISDLKTNSPTVKQQISNLEKVSQNLFELQKFIDTQKLNLEENARTIQKLEKEKDKLEPIVTTQRETVEAILRVHADTQRKSIWQDYLIGFFLGVASSTLVTFLFQYFSKSKSTTKTTHELPQPIPPQ